MNGERAGALRVLIVDDNAQDRAQAKRALRLGSPRDYTFSEAATAEEGLRLCDQEPLPDAMLLDLGLPDAGELEVLARLPRDEDELLRVPVVVLTGSLAQGMNQVALRAGAQDYVGKGWLGPETLTQALENAIERLRQARAFHAQRRVAEGVRASLLALQAQNLQILETSRLKSQFMANMSHELRTPLTAIIGFAELLHGGTVPAGSAQQQAFLGHISSSGHHLLRLINDVLDLSKMEAGKLAFYPEPVNLPLLVGEITDMLRPEAQRKHLHLATEIEAEAVLGPLLLDGTRLKQVLYNYLSNAIKFTPEGGRVVVRTRAHGATHFRLEVEDTGIGIAAEDLPRLFNEYAQLDVGSTKKHQGAGLGLALTRQLVRAQQGSVGVRSTPGQGSVFHAVLNRVHGTDAARCGEGRR